MPWRGPAQSGPEMRKCRCVFGWSLPRVLPAVAGESDLSRILDLVNQIYLESKILFVNCVTLAMRPVCPSYGRPFRS